MSVPQSEERALSFAPKDKTIEVIGMAAFFIVCVLLAAFHEFGRGNWWTGGFFLLLIMMVIGAQLLFLKGHETNYAEILGKSLVLKQGSEQMTLDLAQVQSLTTLKVRRGSVSVNTQFWATMQNGEAWKLFESGTFKEEEDLLKRISELAGTEWRD